MYSSSKGRRASLWEIEEALGHTTPATPPDPVISPLKGRQFLAGPLDWPELCLVAKLGLAPLAVWLLLHLRRKLKGGPWITLPNPRLIEMGVSKWQKQRALALLESEGLIRIAPYMNGRPTMVALVREVRR
jgi:hypothetical protein